MQELYCRDCGWLRWVLERIGRNLTLSYVRKRIIWERGLGCCQISAKKNRKCACPALRVVNVRVRRFNLRVRRFVSGASAGASDAKLCKEANHLAAGFGLLPDFG